MAHLPLPFAEDEKELIKNFRLQQLCLAYKTKNTCFCLVYKTKNV